MTPPRTLVVGDGRAGGAFGRALTAAGWAVQVCHHGDDLDAAADGAALVLLCVPDAAVGATAAGLVPSPTRVVAHCAGSLGLDVLAGHPLAASVHPLVALPDQVTGARRLEGAWFAVAGTPAAAAGTAAEVVAAMGGRMVAVADRDRVRYHAAAVVASNHMVALLGQVQRIAATAGVPLEAYLDLVRATVDNVADLGPVAALTGPVSRGDWGTVARHLDALPPDECGAYLAMAREAARLAGRELPGHLGGGGPAGGTHPGPVDAG